MSRVLSFAVVAVLGIAADTAHAQGGRPVQGPVLVVPRSSGTTPYRSESYNDRASSGAYGSSGYRSDRYGSGYGSGGFYDVEPDRHSGHDHDYGRNYGGVRPGDPNMRMVAEWYRQFLDRPMTPGEAHNWQLHFRDGGSLEGVAAMLLGGDEYYARSGRRFESWVKAIETSTGRRVPRGEEQEWYEDYRRANDRTAARVAFAEHLLEGHEQRPGLAIQPSQPVYPGVTWGTSRPRNDVPWYVQDVAPRHDHDHDHSVGYGPGVAPAGNSDAEAIAGWYRTYFGREIAPNELQKWLSDRQRGMSLDEVYASVLGAQEWYARTGSTPDRWIGSTLDALQQPRNNESIAYWLDRYRRHGGDRFKVSLEMLRGGPRDAGRGDRFDDDDD